MTKPFSHPDIKEKCGLGHALELKTNLKLPKLLTNDAYFRVNVSSCAVTVATKIVVNTVITFIISYAPPTI